MRIRLSELVERLGGTLAGDPSIEITGVAPLDAAGAGHISFLTNPKLREQACASEAAALIVSPSDDAAIAQSYRGARLVTSNPYAYFARTAQWFAQADAIAPAAGIHPQACVDPSARVAPSAFIGPMCVVEAGAEVAEGAVIGAGSFIGRDAFVGPGTVFHPRVTFLAGSRIGARGILHSGAVIGADGFGFANEDGAWIKIPQRGNVVMGDDVEIGANTSIDRGALADTVLEDGVKLDNQIQIGHNCRIGAHTAMAGCVGIAGSATIGKYCTIGGAAMIAGHLVIADRVHVAAGTLVSRSLQEPGQYAGSFPFAKKADWEKNAAILRNLDAMRDRLRLLEKRIKTLNDRPDDE